MVEGRGDSWETGEGRFGRDREREEEREVEVDAAEEDAVEEKEDRMGGGRGR